MRIARYITLGVASVAIVAQSLIGAVPAHAQTQSPQSPAYFNRALVIQRAQKWAKAGVPYDQGGWLKNYRTDCSGFVSMAWGLDRSYVTWSLPEVAKPIAKEDLQPGDILLNTQRHVVMFGHWANSQHTAYVDYEEVGHPWSRAISRVVSYPYDTPTRNDYKPYRFTGGHNLYSPGNTQQTAFMATNAGSGQVSTPGAQAAQMNARIQSDALNRGRQLVKQQQAQAKADAAKRASHDTSVTKAPAEVEHHDATATAPVKTRDAGMEPFTAKLFGDLLGWLSK